MTSAPRKTGSLASALSTGRSLILLQLVSRLLTFTLNQSLLRLASPEVFGTASIQFDLISATILFLSREGIRNALLRSTGRSSGLGVVPLYLGFLVSGAVVTFYLWTSPASTTSQTSFHPALGLYVVAALLELAIEPHYIKALRSDPPRLHVRVQAEGAMAVVKAGTTFLVLYRFPQKALLGMAVGQCAGSVVLAARYALAFGTDGLVWPKGEFYKPTTSLAIANTRQSVIKHFLTEADRIAVGRISPLQDQGGYAIAMNYGSLIARIIFQPLEETLLLHFTSSPSSSHLLRYITHLSSHLLLLLPSFLPPLLPPILSIMLPRQYLRTSAPSTLETYLSWYIPLLSLNGILEAYHTANATPAQMGAQAKWMIASSATFVAALYGLKNRPDIGTETALIGASCAGMVIRITYAALHARRKAGLEVRDMFPKSLTTAVCLGGGVYLRKVYQTGAWTKGWEQWVGLMGRGAVIGLITLGVMWKVEQRGFRELQKSLSAKTD